MTNGNKAPRRGIVARYTDAAECEPPDLHEVVSRTHIAKKLAALKGYEFADTYESVQGESSHIYLVPDHTLVGIEAARRLGVHGEHDLFGGVVPYPFAATKTITHSLVGNGAIAPEGWRADLGEHVHEAVLFGFSAFSRKDARRAGELVLKSGAARVKPARGIGGRGQSVVSNIDELERALERLHPSEISRYGVVIEQNFTKIITHSVGQVRVGELLATYYGRQSLTKDNTGADVYGGSSLIVARGEYDAWFDLEIAPNVRAVISNAQVYEAAVAKAFPQWIASRRNYDVAEVTDDRGRQRYGVLEQSWRIGGASPAEVAALEAFQADHSLKVVRAASVQIYGDADVPANAEVQFRGVDERLGPVTKYTVVQDYDSSD